MRASTTESASFARDDLRDDIPKFIDRLIAWLNGESRDTCAAVDRETTGAHARHRLSRGVALDHLVEEFRLLRQVIMQHVGSGAVVPFDDLVRLNDAIDHAIGETVLTYVNERDASRDLLLGVIGHDLRSPLAAVKAASHVASKTEKIETARAAAERIARSTDRMQRMISDLLDLARARFGATMPVRPEPVDLADLVHNCVDELLLIHTDRRISLEIHGDPSGVWDRARMGQLVANLLANALQHGRDPIVVSVEARGEQVLLQVSNRGDPIEPEILPTLFDPFRRRAGTGDTSNLGLGLFIVSEIVRRHGGNIEVRSNEGETAFIVRLPRMPRLGADAPMEAETLAPPPQ